MTTITRLFDGAGLPTLRASALQVNPDFYGLSNQHFSALGTGGESVVIDSNLNVRQFSLTWICGDSTGDDQQRLASFFSNRELYEIADNDFSVGKTWAHVESVDLDKDFALLTVNFVSRYGADTFEKIETLSFQKMAGGKSSAAIDTSFTNTFEEDAFIRLTLEADRAAVWKARTEVLVEQIPFVIARQDDYGQWVLPQRRKSIVLESTRAVLGDGFFKYPDTQFFRVRPGQSWTIRVAPIQSPLESSSITWTLKLEFYSRMERHAIIYS